MGLVLNLDVMSHIFTRIEENSIGDICRMGYTCRILHEVSVIQLLKRGVVLDKQNHLPSFAAFISKDSTHRTQHLRSLRVSQSVQNPTSPDNLLFLTVILQCCTFVEHVDFHCPFFHVLTIGEAFVALKNIKSLVLRDATAGRILPVLPAMRSQCTAVAIQYDTGQSTDSDYDPTVALVASANSLRTLYLESSELMRSFVVYANVTTLEIHLTGSLTYSRSLVYSFPNLRHLICAQGDAHPSDTEAFHRRNLLGVVGRSYTELDYFSGTVNELYSLALTCPIRRLSLRLSDDFALAVDDGRLASMLREADPTILQVDLVYSRDVSFGEIFRSWSNVAMRKLSHLSLTIVFDDVPDLVYAETLLDCICQFARERNLWYLDLGFYMYPDPDPHLRHPLADLRPISARETDHRNLAAHYFYRWAQFSWAHAKVAEGLFKAVPSLQYVFLDMCPLDASRGWAVDRKSDPPIAVALSTSEAKEVEESEGMNYIYLQGTYV